MTEAADMELDQYKEKTKQQAETLVKSVFPQQVLSLNTLLDSEKFGIDRLSKLEIPLNVPVPDPVLLKSERNDQHLEGSAKKIKLDEMATDNGISGSKVLLMPNGAIHCNHNIVELVDIVKPKILEVIDHCNVVKMWIAYLIPRIEDGNNFGVGIQEDVLAEARQVESEAATYLDQISRYFLTRAKIISKVAKYPHVADYRRAIAELDEKQGLTLRLVLCELRNQYGSLHDMITKNLEKIKKPRSVNHDNMY